MISMVKLKPILEPLLTDENSASIIESISAIDTEPAADIDAAVKSAVDAANAEWNRRFRETFFNGVQQGGEQDPLVPEDDSKVEVVESPTTFEDLFKEE